MAKAQKRGNKEVRKPKKVVPKAVPGPTPDKTAVKLNIGKKA